MCLCVALSLSVILSHPKESHFLVGRYTVTDTPTVRTGGSAKENVCCNQNLCEDGLLLHGLALGGSNGPAKKGGNVGHVRKNGRTLLAYVRSWRTGGSAKEDEHTEDRLGDNVGNRVTDLLGTRCY